ncbi:hypothetical protein PPTG_22004 [Phytophthora nicotianae INRA-310]|uniref:Uncharacterized protein n=1 Tax=Phytophthora nicotianae (strain INRA-310) TaxID=761204 RepID=W2QUA0_PHYN3|nr:hypothetical protein PPTG_22004 [Phytophthora nicotianae INRA-310]ETN15825.1 hypothetical protein PPTG_22004 [Phytophthora nicotianae INRA-310]
MTEADVYLEALKTFDVSKPHHDVHGVSGWMAPQDAVQTACSQL